MQIGRRHSVWRALRAAGCLLLLFPAAGTPADARKPSSAQDLQYGEALFHYYQQDWFGSIVRLEVAQEQHALPHTADEAELLLGGLDLSYGLRGEATRIFERLLDTHSDPQTRNRAWYYLARISWDRADPQAALKALGELNGAMSQGTRTESALLGSLVLLKLGRNQDAIRLLESARKQHAWTPYLAYNLGVAQVRNGQLDAGAKTLVAIGNLETDSEELRSLRDKANLALGYSYLQAGDGNRSRARLEHVRLSGPFSNKALLGTGWADTDTSAFAQALVPWTELGKRDVIDPAVQEALLAVPYALAKLHLHGRAVHGYHAAIDTLTHEKTRLDESIKSIKDGELLNIIDKQDLSSGSGWLQQLTLDSRSPALRYQLTLMATHDFQEAVKNYRDLLALQQNLDQWAERMGAFDDMLETRVRRFAAHRKAAEHALRNNDLAALRQRYATLDYRVRQAETGTDALALANARELQQWEKLQQIGQRLANLPAAAETDDLQARQRLLTGVLRWRLATDFKPRLWQAKRALKQVAQRLEQAQQSLNSLAQARSDTPENFAARNQEIHALRTTLRSLQARTLALRTRQGKQLQRLAVNELQRQQQRIDTYLVQARFALAQTYDTALHAQAEGKP
jgi:hypothetical protein